MSWLRSGSTYRLEAQMRSVKINRQGGVPALSSWSLWHNKRGNARLPLFLFKKLSFRANPLFF